MAMKKIKKCVFCGKDFEAKYSTQKFCSQKCRVENQTYPLRVTNSNGEVMYFRSAIEVAEKLYYNYSSIRDWAINKHRSREGYIVERISLEEYERCENGI